MFRKDHLKMNCKVKAFFIFWTVSYDGFLTLWQRKKKSCQFPWNFVHLFLVAISEIFVFRFFNSSCFFEIIFLRKLLCSKFFLTLTSDLCYDYSTSKTRTVHFTLTSDPLEWINLIHTRVPLSQFKKQPLYSYMYIVQYM